MGLEWWAGGRGQGWEWVEKCGLTPPKAGKLPTAWPAGGGGTGRDRQAFGSPATLPCPSSQEDDDPDWKVEGREDLIWGVGGCLSLQTPPTTYHTYLFFPYLVHTYLSTTYHHHYHHSPFLPLSCGGGREDDPHLPLPHLPPPCATCLHCTSSSPCRENLPASHLFCPCLPAPAPYLSCPTHALSSLLLTAFGRGMGIHLLSMCRWVRTFCLVPPGWWAVSGVYGSMTYMGREEGEGESSSSGREGREERGRGGGMDQGGGLPSPHTLLHCLQLPLPPCHACACLLCGLSLPHHPLPTCHTWTFLCTPHASPNLLTIPISSPHTPYTTHLPHSLLPPTPPPSPTHLPTSLPLPLTWIPLPQTF